MKISVINILQLSRKNVNKPQAILIKGFGSIGQRHYDVLKCEYPNSKIDIITSKDLPRSFSSFQDIPNLDYYDYFILATPTSEHYKELEFLDKKLKNKIIFVEKPLFSSKHIFIPSNNNQIYVGYVLRFHPLIQYIKKIMQKNNAYFVEVSCGSYLPHWRPNVDYRKIYSAKSELGGGVLLDLSHEIDYLQWVFGSFQEIKGVNTKVSELEIDTDDLATFIIKTTKKTIINLTLNYFSKIPKRVLIIHTDKFSIEIDLVSNTLKKINQEQQITKKTFCIERNDLFKKMHKNTLESPKKKILPNIYDGMQIMKIVARMKNDG